MRKTLSSLLALALMAPPFTFAVTWTMDSGPFQWPGTGAAQRMTSVTTADHLSCRLLPGKRVALHVDLPSNTSTAAISIYSLQGALVYSARVTAHDKTIIWNCSDGLITAGMFVAILRFGSTEEQLKVPVGR